MVSDYVLGRRLDKKDDYRRLEAAEMWRYQRMLEGEKYITGNRI